MSKDLVQKWFNKLSNSEKDKPLLVLNGLGYTPRQANDEVQRGTPVGDQLQRLIEQGRFGTAYVDEQELIKQRLTMSLDEKPAQDKVMFVALPSSGLAPKAFTPRQLKQEIQSGTAVGKQWIDGERSYMLRLLQVR